MPRFAERVRDVNAVICVLAQWAAKRSWLGISRLSRHVVGQGEKVNIRLLEHGTRSISERHSCVSQPLHRLIDLFNIGVIPTLDLDAELA